jgi:hypothetical protein
VARQTATGVIGRTNEKERRRVARSGRPSGERRFRAITAVAVAAASLLAITGTPAGARHTADTGFSTPFSGAKIFEHLAPTEATRPDQVNQEIGRTAADQIAKGLGLRADRVLSERQYRLFITGRGKGGNVDDAKLADESVRIFTNTEGHPLVYIDERGQRVKTVLASYGLFVNEQGLVQSLANPDAPTRIANRLLTPRGYINTWFLANGAASSLIQLYRSAYTIEALYGNQAQQQSSLPSRDPYQLVTNTKDGVTTQVGMSMAPALWLTNFALLYTLKPEIAAAMPGYWAPIPEDVVDKILATDTGQVPYSEVASYFESSRCGTHRAACSTPGRSRAHHGRWSSRGSR